MSISENVQTTTKGNKSHFLSQTKISYEVIGNLNSTETLLFIHGAGGNKKALRALAMQFSDYKCILIDLPGHYMSGGKSLKSIDEYADAIKAFLQSEKKVLGDNITCIGHSMGGFITLELALKKVPEIKRIVILNSGAYIAIDSKFMKKVKNGIIDKLYLFKCSGSFFHPRTYKFFLLNFSEMFKSQKVMCKDFLVVQTFDRRADIKNITLPTLIATGQRERLALPEASEFMHSEIKGSKLLIMKGVSHLMPLIIPEKLAVEMKKFFHENPIVSK
jgi:pimeloyl-ACP methyl ester carboxylesterase